VRPASVRTSAAGITPPAIDSTIADSPEYRPVPVMVTRMPTSMPLRPVPAWRLISATVGGVTGGT
jgi:hypothetical protein